MLSLTRRNLDLPVALALGAALAGVGLIGATRNGLAEQMPHWDSAFFYEAACDFERHLREEGIGGFARAWVHQNRTHTPLVPALSGILMLVFGKSFLVALSVVPLFGFLWCLSVIKGIGHLYPGSAATRYGAAAIAASFPVVLNQTRLYLYEFPFAALAAAAIWAMLASDGFLLWRPSLAFGVLCGLAGLARGGGPAVLAGPVIVGFVAAMRRPPRGPRLRNAGIAAITAALFLSTWYVPNFLAFLQYIKKVTYGNEASVFAGSEGAFTLENVLYYFKHNIIDGAGAPLLVLGVASYLLGCVLRRKWGFSPVAGALAATYALTYLILMVAAQRCGALLFLPILPIQAIAVVRGILWIPARVPRIVAGVIAAALAVHHVYALTFGFATAWNSQQYFGPFGAKFPLWNHNDSYLQVTERDRPERNYRPGLEETQRIVERAAAGRNETVLLLSHNSFINCQNFRTLHHNWPRSLKLTALPFLAPDTVAQSRHLLVRDLIATPILIIRTSVPKWGPPEEGRYHELAKDLITGESRIFDAFEKPVELPDGSHIQVYVWRPELRAALDALRAELTNDPLPPKASMAVLSRHPFVRLMAINLEELLHSKGNAQGTPDLDPNEKDGHAPKEPAQLRRFCAGGPILARRGAPEQMSQFENECERVFSPLWIGPSPIFRRAALRIPLPDGSSLELLRYNTGVEDFARDVAARAEIVPPRIEPQHIAVVGDGPLIEQVREKVHAACEPKNWEYSSFPSIHDYIESRASAEPRDSCVFRRRWSGSSMLVFVGGGFPAHPASAFATKTLKPLIEGGAISLVPSGSAMVAPGGGAAHFYEPAPRVDWVESLPQSWVSLNVKFAPPADYQGAAPIVLASCDVHDDDGWLRIDLGLEAGEETGRFPVLVLRLIGAGGEEIETQELPPIGFSRPEPGSGRRRFAVLHAFAAQTCGGCSKRPAVRAEIHGIIMGGPRRFDGLAKIALPPSPNAR